MPARPTSAGAPAAAAGWWGGFAAAGGYGYQNTEIGQIIVLAYLDAYKKLVTQLGGADPIPDGRAAALSAGSKVPGVSIRMIVPI